MWKARILTQWCASTWYTCRYCHAVRARKKKKCYQRMVQYAQQFHTGIHMVRSKALVLSGQKCDTAPTASVPVRPNLACINW